MKCYTAIKFSACSPPDACDGDVADKAKERDSNSPNNVPALLLPVVTLLVMPFRVSIFVVLTLVDISNAFLSFLFSRISNSDKATATYEPNLKGHIPIQKFEIDSPKWTWNYLRTQYVRKGVPFILKPSKLSGPIGSFGLPGFDERSGQWANSSFREGVMELRALPMLTRIPGVHSIVDKLTPCSIYWALPTMVFSGNYGSSSCHLDITPNGTNLYWMKRGCKDVVLVPPHETRKVRCVENEDSFDIVGSVNNHDYLQTLAAYYRFTLEEGEILVFNPATFLHHFSGLGESPPIGVSIRCLDFYYAKGADPRVWLSNMTSPQVWWRESKNAARMFCGIPVYLYAAEKKY